MPTPPLSREDAQAAVDALRAAGGNQTQAARALGMDRNTYRHRLAAASRYGLMLDAAPAMPGFEVARVTTTEGADGTVKSRSIVQRPEAGEPFAVPPGAAVRRATVQVSPDGRVERQWLRYGPDDVDPMAFAEALREAMLEARGSWSDPGHSLDLDDDLLTVYVVPDLHLGMMAWGPESGESYDVKIAREMMRADFARLVAGSPPAGGAVLLFLGDYFHMNDQRNVTPRSGHQLDVDGRWRKVFGVGARVAVAAADAVAARHRDVEVVTLPGNHDEDAARALDVALELRFEGHDRVRVPGTAGLHWFRRHGDVLLGATHGHTLKPDRMAMMLATERPEDWGASRFRRLFFGHVHHERKVEIAGVIVESFSAAAARDAYAAGGGYRAERALNAVTFHRTRGEVSRHRVTVGA